MTLKRLFEGIVVIAIVSGMAVLLIPAIRAARQASIFPSGPYGEMIPKAAPQEGNRITHTSGVSIVVPTNWAQIDRRPFLCVSVASAASLTG